MANQWHFDPDTYLAMVRSEIPRYDELQDTLAEATTTVHAARILDLGSGTGVTARNVLTRHPGASLLGIDSSDEMLSHARRLLPDASFEVARLEDALPPGPFDLVVSAFAIHHLDGPEKAGLFRRVAAVLADAGRFVFLDVVIPVDEVAQPVPLEDGVDLPSSVDDQLEWLRGAGLDAEVVLADADVAIVTAAPAAR